MIPANPTARMLRPTLSATRLLHAVLALATIVAAACAKDGNARQKRLALRFRHPAVWAPATLTQVQGVPINEVKAAIVQRLSAAPPERVSANAWRHTRALYKSLGETPLWFTSDGLAKDRVRALTDAVLASSEDALRLDEYPIVELSNAVLAVRDARTASATSLAEADVLLSAMYAALGVDLLVGQVSPRAVGQAWHIDPNDEDVDSALVHTLGDTLSNGIQEMRPAEADYARLKTELQRYRDIVAKGDWPTVASGRMLKPGQPDSRARIESLRKRLAVEGYAVDSIPNDLYDRSLADAVELFQDRHGLTVTGQLNAETVASLNVSAAYRLGQIAANLERLRWLPHTLGNRYVYVNVPAFRLIAYDSGAPSLEMKVIVGQEFEDKATPVFSDNMETVVFRPYWNVTPAIQAKEIDPKVAADPGYLTRENMEYYNDGGQRRVRQRPGGKNALGFVKFLFPNDFNIYMHDTPNHELFNKEVRAFSHGCIRLEKPAELAEWVLGWDGVRVHDAMMNGPDNRSVRLSRKIPVYILYGTVFVRDSTLHFGNDLYHRDERLIQATAPGALPGETARNALEQLKRIAH